MIATLQPRPPGWAAHGGIDILEPACAYDAFVALATDLHSFGAWPEDVLAAWLWRRWFEIMRERADQGQSEQPPDEVRRLFDRAAWRRGRAFASLANVTRSTRTDAFRRLITAGLGHDEAVDALGWAPTKPLGPKKRSRPLTGRRPRAPRRFDRERMRELLLAGVRSSDIAAMLRCSEQTVYNERKALGLAQADADARAEALREAREGLARYRALRAEGWSLCHAAQEIGVTRATIRQWQDRLYRHGEDTHED